MFEVCRRNTSCELVIFNLPSQMTTETSHNLSWKMYTNLFITGYFRFHFFFLRQWESSKRSSLIKNVTPFFVAFQSEAKKVQNILLHFCYNGRWWYFWGNTNNIPIRLFCTMQKFQQFIFGALKAEQKLHDYDRVNIVRVTFFNLQSLFTVALSWSIVNKSRLRWILDKIHINHM